MTSKGSQGSVRDVETLCSNNSLSLEHLHRVLRVLEGVGVSLSVNMGKLVGSRDFAALKISVQKPCETCEPCAYYRKRSSYVHSGFDKPCAGFEPCARSRPCSSPPSKARIFSDPLLFSQWPVVRNRLYLLGLQKLSSSRFTAVLLRVGTTVSSPVFTGTKTICSLGERA